MKRKEKYSWRRILRNNLFSLSFLWKNSKPFFIFSLLQIVISGLEAPAALLLRSRLFTMLDGDCSFRDALYVTISLLALNITVGLWSQIFLTYISPIYKEKMQYKIQLAMFERARKIELAKYDDPVFYNDYILSMQFTDTYFMTAIDNLSGFFRSALMFVSIFQIVFRIDVFTCFLILISSFLSGVLGNKLKKVKYDEQLATADNQRKDGYIERTFKLADFAKELRMTHLKECLDKEYDENTAGLCRLVKRFRKKKLKWEFCALLNIKLIYGIIISILLYKLAVTGTITLGDFTVVVNADLQFRGVLHNLADLITELPTQSRKMDTVRSFVSDEQTDNNKIKEIPEFQSLTFDRVSFGYTPDEDSLHDISLTIRKNEKIAIVGYNGAGKSTFIKLLMGLYTPNSGTILYNGIDINDFDRECYRKKMSAVFQDYKIFSATLAENVLGDEYTEEKEKTVLDALGTVGFAHEVLSWKDGIQTVLTREFDPNGRNLSGGEAQKTAIARAFAANGELIIMDEPSSALDPVAEYELNSCIMEYAKDKTVLLISHRLSTTVGADRIYMFDGGRLIETGSHRELMAQNGKYAEIFRTQAEKYIR